MRTFFLAFSLLLASTCAVRADMGDNLIVWWLDDPMIEEVNGGAPVSMAELVGRGGEAEGLGISAVRVKMTNADGFSYLDLEYEGGSQSWIDLPGLVENEDGSISERWAAGPTFANISNYTLDRSDASLSFMIELGNYSDDGKWIVLAASQSSSLGDLYEAGFVLDSELSYQQGLEWTGGAYSVPEPSSGLLILIGGALLALRRRRRAA